MDTLPLPAPPRRSPTTVAALVWLVLAALVLTAGSLTSAAGALVDTEVVDALEVDGRVIEFSDASLNSAADRANDAGIAFAWLDRSGDDGLATRLADQYIDDLSAREAATRPSWSWSETVSPPPR